MYRFVFIILLMTVPLCARTNLEITGAPAGGDFILADKNAESVIFIGTNEDVSVIRCANDLVGDFLRVTGRKPVLEHTVSAGLNTRIIVGTLGRSGLLDELAAAGKLETNGITGQWESYSLQMVTNPLPGVDRALVIAGSDRRGTIYGVYTLSEMMGVSPWYWWADVPVAHLDTVALHGKSLRQGPPAVKYRGIFLNDEDWGLAPWAAKTFDVSTGNIGPKTYEKIYELLLRLRANCLWPAMHPGTSAFNSFPENSRLAQDYGIIMGSSHCEQMLRNNISEWDEKKYGGYNFVTNVSGVLGYWEERVRTNGKFENIYTLGMRGIHDGAMPGGGTEREKAKRLETIISDQRQLLSKWVNPVLQQVPQIFCPYKEVLPLYRLMKDMPGDITLVWPDDNYGYIREFSSMKERTRSGGAGVYYHVSYFGRPRDYLWLCSTPPALIAEEMVKAYDYGASGLWMLNVGDLKPAEFDMEFFLRLGWNPGAWQGTNTYKLLEKQIARDFGPMIAPEITSIMAEYYRLNFQRKPEHVWFPTNNLFSPEEITQRLQEWEGISQRVEVLEKKLPIGSRDAFFEFVGYPVRAAAAMNRLSFTGSKTAADEIRRLTEYYNESLAGGKWRYIMSSNPRGQVEPKTASRKDPAGESSKTNSSQSLRMERMDGGNTSSVEKIRLHKKDGFFIPRPSADLLENHRSVTIEAEDASEFVPGKEARWVKISGLGYNGVAVAVSPTMVSVCDSLEKILACSPRLEYKIRMDDTGDWSVIVRTLPTFSVEKGRSQRYAIAFDDMPPQIVSLPHTDSETDRQWQENVLRNAALTTSIHFINQAGSHTMKIWMVDPGIVIDTVAVETKGTWNHGYLWPKPYDVEGVER